MQRYDIVDIVGTTDESGDATADSPGPVLGEVVYVEVDGADLTDGADLILQPVHVKVDGTEELGESIVNHGDIGNATVDTLYPMRFGQDNAGSALAVEEGVSVPRLYFVPGCKLRAKIANGGDTKAFRVRVYVR